jgi:hypothetical protein
MALGITVWGAHPAQASITAQEPGPAMGVALQSEAQSAHTAVGFAAVIVVLTATMLLRRTADSNA